MVALLCCDIAAEAQIKVTKKTEINEVFSSRMGYVTICESNGNYYLSLPSSNQFDDPYIILLGQTKKEALESVVSLWQMAQDIKKGETYEIETKIEKFTIGRGMTKGTIAITASGYAGFASTSATELKGMIDALRKQ